MSVAIPVSTLEKFTTFGDLLRYLRRRAGITQIDLSLAVGYSNAQISRLEQNLRPPDPTTIEARFVPALGLEQEPHAVTRLLELAANVRREDAPAAGLCPYKGLSYFDEGDADLFVGREALTSKLAGRVLALAKNGRAGGFRFLAVVGASGSGKSSLIRAGLVPSLRWGEASAGWPIYTLTPTVHPLESLAIALEEEESVASVARFTEDLACSPRCLHLFCTRVAQAAGASYVLLIVDQFEELFSLCRVEAERQAFIAALLDAASDAGGPTLVVITLRADFYTHCAAYPELRSALASCQEYIGSLNDEELRRAIEEPARRGRWEFEPGLVDLLVHDVGHEPGALPLLSHALLETWERRRGHTMTLGGYVSSGGVRGAIAETAQAVFTDQFTPEQQAIARRVFLHLTELGDETGTGDTRRRATFEELIVEPRASEATRAVLNALADSRLITITGDAVEVAHEALIREWPTLRGWLEDDREGLRLHRHLADAAREWVVMNREKDALYRGGRLIQASEWAAKNPHEITVLEREFVEASVREGDREAAEKEAQRQSELEAAHNLANAERQHAAEQERTSNRLRVRNRIISGVGAAALLLAALAGFFGWQSARNAGQAGKNLATAQASQARAESLRLAAEANVLLARGGDPQAAVLLSVRALQGGYSPQADSALWAALTQLDNRQIFRGHTGAIYAVAISPDGKYALTGSLDGTARLWDMQTGQELRQFASHSGGITSVAISPDGRLVATGGNDRTVRVWDANSGKQLRVLTGHSEGITSVTFSPEGLYLLSASGDQTARLWDAQSGQLIRMFIGHGGLVSAAVFAPDGQHVLTGSFDDTVRLWDTETGQATQTFIGPQTGSGNRHVTSVAFSPDGKTVLVGRDDHEAGLWNTATGQQTCLLIAHTGTVNAVAFSSDGKYLLTGSEDGSAIVWSAKTCEKVRQYAIPALRIKSVAFSPDGWYILAGGSDNIARLWAAPISPPLRTFAAVTPDVTFLIEELSGQRTLITGGVTSVAVSPNGQYVVAGAQDNIARMWDLEKGTLVHALVGHTGMINDVAFSPDGKLVLTASDDYTFRLWDSATGRPIRTIQDGTLAASGVAFSPNGEEFLSTGMGGGSNIPGILDAKSTRLWDVLTGKMIDAFDTGYFRPTGDIKARVAFAPDGTHAVVRGQLWDRSAGWMFNVVSRQWTCTTQDAAIGQVYSVAVSKDGKYALTGGSDNTARLWDTLMCRQIRVFTDGKSMVLSVAFSPDGNYVLTGHNDNVARIWDANTGALVRQYTGHTGWINSAVFTPDGLFVITGSQDGTVRIWDTDYHDTIRFACSILWRDLTPDERLQYGITGDAPTCPKQ